MSDEIRSLGRDILFYEGNSAELLRTLSNRRRFLNKLWLPCPLGELDAEQVTIINRFREKNFGDDKQFEQCQSSRESVLRFLEERKVRTLLEIGCGKFPLVTEATLDRYRAIEIDKNAILALRELGYEIGQLDAFGADTKFDMVVALYAFHFAVSERLVAYINDTLEEDGFLIFNLIVDDSYYPMKVLSTLSTVFSCNQVLKTSRLATREFFVIMGRTSVAGEIRSVAGSLLKFLSEAKQ